MPHAPGSNSCALLTKVLISKSLLVEGIVDPLQNLHSKQLAGNYSRGRYLAKVAPYAFVFHVSARETVAGRSRVSALILHRYYRIESADDCFQ